MNKFIVCPNLPSKKVTGVIAGNMPESVKNGLVNKKIEIFETINNSVLQGCLSSHADLQAIHIGKNRILLEKNQSELAKSLGKSGFSIDFFNIKGGEYPLDCAVNAAIFGKNVICRFDILDETLKTFLLKNNYNIINVKQGYSKCSVCIVNDNSIITEDETIKNACEKNGIDVLLIRKGYVKLKGFDYGFIGGASFLIDKNVLAFIGKIENHPDFLIIKEFLNKKNVEYISLGNNELTDIGSVLPITE